MKQDSLVDQQPLSWVLFVWLGLAAVLMGGLALKYPVMSHFVTGTILGVVLSLAGVFKMVRSLWAPEWLGFFWEELNGAAELVGGVMVFFNPVKGAIAISLLIAFIFLIHGLLQIALAVRLHGLKNGWYWFVASGTVTLLASIALFVKLAMARTYSPDILAGLALTIAGSAYLAVAYFIRRARL